MKRLLILGLLITWLGPALAEEAPSPPPRTVAMPTTAAELVCPPPAQLAQVSQAECCKANKGVCGCRAGKIICCDNTVSTHCTCHGDSGLEN